MLVLGLGSNCGDRLWYLRDTIHRIQDAGSPELNAGVNAVEVTGVSPLYESDALLPPGAPSHWNKPFLNMNLLCSTTLAPLELLQFIKSIEAQIGRTSRGRWAPREIDIDILVMDHLNFRNDLLQIPHPDLLKRPFAMLPLTDLVPNWVISTPGSYQGMKASHYVKPWKRNWDSVPFRTQKSSLAFTELMGILNITPDSFSDGGLHGGVETAMPQAHKLIHDGINILDIGGESTRPGARLLETDEEWNRIGPVLQAIEASRDVPNETKRSPFFDKQIRLSVDTRNPEIASRAIGLNVDWINDVSGFANDEMKEAVAKALFQPRHSDRSENSFEAAKFVKVVVMHSLSVPPKKDETLSPHEDPIDQLIDWAEGRIKDLQRFGIERNRIIFDPGLGFGKSPQQSWEILSRAQELHKLRVPLLFGHSRKSFLSTLTDKRAQDRDVETSTLSVELAKKGVSYLRVHNAEQNARALRTWIQLSGCSQW